MAFTRTERDILGDIVDELIRNYGYSKGQIALKYLLEDREVDAVVYKDTKRKVPFIIIEVKRHIVYPIDSPQIEHYLKASGARYGLITNGETKFCFESFRGRVLKIPDIPRKGKRREQTLLKTQLRAKTGLEYSLQKIGEYLRERGAFSDKTLRELLKLLLCKLTDERSLEPTVHFWLSPSEAQEFQKPQVRETFTQRINYLFERVKETYPDLYNPNEKLELEPEILSYLISELQDYSLLQMPIDSVASAFQSFIINSIHGYSGEYSTPKILLDFMVQMLDPEIEDTILDPACGTGGFLIKSMHHVWEKLRLRSSSPIFKSKSDYARTKLFGIDISGKMISTCKMNMVLQGDGSANIYQQDFLEGLKNVEPHFPKRFDRVVTDPPLQGFVSNSGILQKYSLGRERKSQRKLVLFIEKCLKMLKNGGRMAIVLPDALLASISLKYVREFILSEATLEAIISFTDEISLFYSGAKVSVILLSKNSNKRGKTFAEKLNVFMAEVGEQVENSLEEILNSYRSFKQEKKIVISKGVFTVKPHALYKRWDVSFHRPMKLELHRARPLEELCQVMSGAKVSSRKYFDSGGDDLVPYLRISNIVEGTLVGQGLRFVKKSEIRESSVRQGDVLLSVRGTIGKTAFVTKDFEGSIAGSQIAILRPKKDLIDSKYLYRILSSETVSKQLQRAKIGQFIAFIALRDLRRVLIPYPPLRKQLEIVRKINTLEKEGKGKSLATNELQKEIKNILKEAIK